MSDDKPVACLSQRRPTWTWAAHDGYIRWLDLHELFRANEHFALIRTDLEFQGESPAEFSPVIGGSIKVTGKTLFIEYQQESESSAFTTFLAGYRVRLLFDHPRPSRKPSLWAALSNMTRKNLKVAEALVLGGWPIFINQRIYFLLLKPYKGISSYVRVGTGYITYPAGEKEKVEALFTSSMFTTRNIRLY